MGNKLTLIAFADLDETVNSDDDQDYEEQYFEDEDVIDDIFGSWSLGGKGWVGVWWAGVELIDSGVTDSGEPSLQRQMEMSKTLFSGAHDNTQTSSSLDLKGYTTI